MKQVVITGATGFLGGYLVKEFVANGYKVIAIGRNAARLAELADTHVETIAASLAELAGIKIETDFVVHAAALSTVWGSWEKFYINNVKGTMQVASFCKLNNVQRLVYVSSPSIYAKPTNMLDINEAMVDPHNRLNNYIRSKIAAEAYITKYFRDITVILRPRGLIGPGDTSIAPRLIRANAVFGIPLFNNGSNLVDLTCVENVALACRLSVESSEAAGNIYNISNGTPLPIKELCESLFEAIGQKPRFRKRNAKVLYAVAGLIELIYHSLGITKEPPITRYIVTTLAYSQTLSITHARHDLGYMPVVPIAEGIKRYAEASYAEA